MALLTNDNSQLSIYFCKSDHYGCTCGQRKLKAVYQIFPKFCGSRNINCNDRIPAKWLYSFWNIPGISLLTYVVSQIGRNELFRTIINLDLACVSQLENTAEDKEMAAL